jgi:hypothetical protein
MLKPRAKSGQSKSSPDFWKLLYIFWNEDQIEKWRSTIFPDSQNPNVGIERCFDRVSLCPDARDMWNRGVFALKPLKLSRSQKKLTVQFFWQVPGNHDMESRVDLLTEPTSSEGLEIVGPGYFLSRLENDGSDPRIRPIRSGQTFTFTTEDPKNLPLPSLELLEMQWILQRLVGMCDGQAWTGMMTLSIMTTVGLFRTIPTAMCTIPWKESANGLVARRLQVSLSTLPLTPQLTAKLRPDIHKFLPYTFDHGLPWTIIRRINT